MTLPAQNAYSGGRRRFAEEHVGFSPAGALEARRVRGSIIRGRRYVCPCLREERMKVNAALFVEPRFISDVPA